jgi:16S rRNA processing protein RimM
MTADDPANEPVVVGRIAGAYGVLGWVRIVSYTEPPENLVSYRHWLIREGDRWQPVTPATARPHGPGYVVQLRELANRNEAQALTGRLVAVPRSELPELEHEFEYYWRDLVGLTVRDPQGRMLGRVDHLIATGAHDVLAIEIEHAPGALPRDEAANGKRPQLLVPFLRQFVPHVDLAGRVLVIDWQEPD